MTFDNKFTKSAGDGFCAYCGKTFAPGDLVVALEAIYVGERGKIAHRECKLKHDAPVKQTVQ